MDCIDDEKSFEGRTKKRLKLGDVVYHLKINDLYKKATEEISQVFSEGKVVKLENGAEIFSVPFTCCILPHFVQPEDYVKELQQEVTQMKLKKKINDLYQFDQSDDLKDCLLPQVKKFKQFLHDTVLQWMKEVTKIPLADEISLFSSSYTSTDHLLCHDDELEGRRIAFIFYLVPEWTEQDGGNLEFFNTVNGFPNEVCRTVVPKWNNFVFFEVSPVSFHQVSEVLSSKRRIALSGWFHGPPIKRPIIKLESIMFKEPVSQEIDIRDWINPLYFDAATQLDIRTSFEENSEILLAEFLQMSKFSEVCEALQSSDTSWVRKGPANCRNIFEADENNVPAILKECCAFLSSEAFLLILSNITALSFHPMCEDGGKMGKVFTSVRKWSPGSYTLLRDQSFNQDNCLNAFLYFNCVNWKPSYNGFCSFVADGEDEELLRIEPTSNSLALVYASEGTSHFVKYVNSKAKEHTLPFFHDVFCLYIENNDENSGE